MSNHNEEVSDLKTAIGAANTIKGAVKTGKSVAGAAKGASAGPYGAIAGALWENRETVAKVAVIVAGICLIPVMFIVMLPSIIFDGVNGTYDDPILNKD